ncbi:MAG: hypothetical protein AAFN93_09660 [Bacteroidota bacterium]
MMENGQIINSKKSTLPPLKDPEHPGIFLISRIFLLSITLFLLLTALTAYTSYTISLDFELDLNGFVQDSHIVLYAEESKAATIRPGDKAEVSLDNGQIHKFAVQEISSSDSNNDNSKIIILKPAPGGNEDKELDLGELVGQSVSATVFTKTRSLWSFAKDKISL